MAINKEEISSKWWTRETVAVVTGANKGIGFEIVRQLAENGLTVVLTARDPNRGLSATKRLHDLGLDNVVFSELDIQNPHSVSEFTRWLKNKYGYLNILVNNAGVSGFAMDKEATVQALDVSNDIFNKELLSNALITNYEMSENCIEINYYGTRRVTEALLPFLRSEGRIVNLSSEAGLLKFLENDSLRGQFSDVSKMREESIDSMLQMFLDDMKMDKLEGKGWPPLAPHYGLSKIALNAYARLLAQKLQSEYCGQGKRRVYVNNVDPVHLGDLVQTEMTGYLGTVTPSQAAECCVMLALSPPGTGQLYIMKEPHSF